MPNMKEIRKMARQLEIRSTRMEKAELIRAIQRAEGNYDWLRDGDRGGMRPG